jgi:tetratricopeptide (TPR) repeat protein
VFWVHASNAARIEQGYRDIADQVKLADRKDPQADVFKLVHNWLRNEKYGKWLLVIDNTDDEAAFYLPASGGDDALPRYFSSYLPQSKNGSILVTSRTRSVASQLVEESDIIPIEPMNEVNAQALLQMKLGEEVDKSAAAELVRALEFMPLALVQAASYIRQRAPRCSVRQYLEAFYKSDRNRTSLLEHDGGRLRRDKEAKNSILITWQISFDYILHTRRSAADLLSLMSFFDRQGIPEALVRDSRKTRNRRRGVEAIDADGENSDSEGSEMETNVNNGFEEDILTLRSYSFIALTTNATTFDMHRLVQLATRKWLEEHGQLETWKEQYINNLNKAFPTEKYENWTQCQALFPHAKSALSHPPKSEESRMQWAELFYHAASYALEQGNLSDAETLAVKSMQVCRDMLNQDHKDVQRSTIMVALTFSNQGRWKEAEELGMQVMETRKRVLGEEHLDTLKSMSSLAATFRKQGRWKEAEELEVQVIETIKRVHGEEHLYMLDSMGNLAATYEKQGRWKEAEELEVQVMETRKRVLGEEHLDTRKSMSSLAATFGNQGRWKEAEDLLVQVVRTRKRMLGEEHLDTLDSIHNLASTYRKQGRWKEAKELEVQVMETKKRALRKEHLYTLDSMGNLAATYEKQGRWKEAEELEVQVMETKKKVLREEHLDTLESMGSLATTYGKQGRWKEAEELEVQVMETRKRMLGEEHLYTLDSMGNLAATYEKQGR